MFLIQEKEKHDANTLTRKIGESIYIGDDVKLTVLENDGSQVRIGIAAPKFVPVHREEIYYRAKQGEKDGNR